MQSMALGSSVGIQGHCSSYGCEQSGEEKGKKGRSKGDPKGKDKVKVIRR